MKFGVKKIFGVAVLCTFTVLFGCDNNQTESADPVLASVQAKNLHYSDLIEELPLSITGDDSVKFVNDYIDKWIKQQLLVAEAEKNLSSDQLKIDREIEKYRQELIIFNYKNKRYNEIINREISEDEITGFYQKNIDKYVLDEPIVQVSYIIFPGELIVPEKIKKSLVSNKEKDILEYEDFIFRFAKKYDNFDNNWMFLNNLLQQTHYILPDAEEYIKHHKIIEIKKDNEFHLIVVNDFRVAGQNAPIEFVTPKIKGSIISHQKLDFLREIKDSLYNDALKYNKFRVNN